MNRRNFIAKSERIATCGFKAPGFSCTRNSIGLFYRWHGNRIEFVSNYSPPSLGYFDLTDQQVRDFKAGRLGLVPPGFCNPAGGASLENGVIIWDDPVKNAAHLEEIFAAHR